MTSSASEAATVPAPEIGHEPAQQFLSFFFGGEEYAAAILSIREVVELQRVTPVPTAPAWVRGVMNLRGTVIPIVDLAAKLQGSRTEIGRLTCALVFEVEVEGEPTPVGVMIDSVGRVLDLAPDDLQEPPAFGSPVRPELLHGLGLIDDQAIPVLRIQKVLTEEELAETVAGAESGVDAEPEGAAETGTGTDDPSRRGADGAPGSVRPAGSEKG